MPTIREMREMHLQSKRFLDEQKRLKGGYRKSPKKKSPRRSPFRGGDIPKSPLREPKKRPLSRTQRSRDIQKDYFSPKTQYKLFQRAGAVVPVISDRGIEKYYSILAEIADLEAREKPTTKLERQIAIQDQPKRRAQLAKLRAERDKLAPFVYAGGPKASAQARRLAEAVL